MTRWIGRQRHLERRKHLARFHGLNTIEDFDWRFNPKLPKQELFDLAITPSHRAISAIVRPLARYSSINSALLAADVTLRPSASRFSPVSTNSVVIDPIRLHYPRFDRLPMRSSAGRLQLSRVLRPCQRSRVIDPLSLN